MQGENLKIIATVAALGIILQAGAFAAEPKNTAKPGAPASDTLWVVSDIDTPADAAKRPNKTISYSVNGGSSFDEAYSKCKQKSDRPSSCRLFQKFKGDKKIAIARLRVNGGISTSDEGARFFVKSLPIDGKGLDDVKALAIDECKGHINKFSPSDIYNNTEPCSIALAFNNDAFIHQEAKIAREELRIARERSRIARENLNNFMKTIPSANNQRQCGADGQSINGEYSYSYNPDCGFRVKRCSPMGQSPEGCQYYKY
jgi:hypothetical protein